MTASISIEHLSMKYTGGTQALGDVSFSVEAGQRVVILGENGSGKSTLLKCLIQVERPTGGRVKIGDTETTELRGRNLRELRRRVGFVFQDSHLVESLSAFRNVLHGALGRSRGTAMWFAPTVPSDERNLAMQCLDRVGLAAYAGRRVDSLSGGQKQRVALARLLMQRPTVVLADEPVAALDPNAGRRVMDLLWTIGEEEHMTILCTLHQLELAEQYSDRLVALREGHLVLDRPGGTPLVSEELECIYGAMATGSDERVGERL